MAPRCITTVKHALKPGSNPGDKERAVINASRCAGFLCVSSLLVRLHVTFWICPEPQAFKVCGFLCIILEGESGKCVVSLVILVIRLLFLCS